MIINWAQIEHRMIKNNINDDDSNNIIITRLHGKVIFYIDDDGIHYANLVVIHCR